MKVHLVDGTYELFRQYYGQHHQARRSQPAPEESDAGASLGVARSVLRMISEGASHLAVATDHVIESFRNEMWPSYKDSSGVPADLLGQFDVLEELLESLGVSLFPMVELEADDALGSLASVCDEDKTVDQVIIWTPDKDLGQCVRGDRVIQYDRRNKKILDEAAVVEKFGVRPVSIPDFLALVGDSADGFPGIRGWGRQTASAVLSHYLEIEAIPLDPVGLDPGVAGRLRNPASLLTTLAEHFDNALLFRELARLRIDRSLLPGGAGELMWRGPDAGFAGLCQRLGDPGLAELASSLSSRRA